MQTKRYASKSATHCYPLPCGYAVDWNAHEGVFYAEIPLDTLHPDEMLVPGLCIPNQPYAYSITLSDQRHDWHLSPVGQSVLEASAAECHPAVSSHVDFFHIHERVDTPVLQVKLYSNQPPEDYLLVIALHTQAANHQPEVFPAISLDLPGYSQMDASAALRMRICSPTCVRMVLDFHGHAAEPNSLIADCYDQASDLYGVWPTNIMAAANRGMLGGVETFGNMHEAGALLSKAVPVITSIRFTPGALTGAPLTDSAGHLVVLSGIDGAWVQVADPAAPNAEDVIRRYALDEFSRAWLDHRGIGYVLVPFEKAG